MSLRSAISATAGLLVIIIMIIYTLILESVRRTAVMSQEITSLSSASVSSIFRYTYTPLLEA